MRVLEEDGVVIRKQGVGTFYSDAKLSIRSTLDLNEGVTEMIIGKGMIPGSKFKEIKTIMANKKLAKKLQVSLDELLFVISRVRTADEIPIAYTIDYLPQSLISGNLPGNFIQESLYKYMEEKLNIKISNSLLFIEPIALSKSIAVSLNVKPGTLSLLLKQTDSDTNSRCVLYSEEYFIYNRFEFVVFRKRKV
jgi:GntR family transcriptional regulator